MRRVSQGDPAGYIQNGQGSRSSLDTLGNKLTRRGRVGGTPAPPQAGNLSSRAHAAVAAGRWSYVERTVRAFHESGDRELELRGYRMAECCNDWSYLARWNGRAKMRPIRCDDKLCPNCAAHRTRGIKRLIDHQLQKNTEVRFITLTQGVISGESAPEARARLLRSWGSLWRKQKRSLDPYIVGGIRRVEFTWSVREWGWHCHLHVLAEGRYWHQDDLSEAWVAAGGGPVVDIRQATDARELLKYVVKVATLPGERIVEYAQTLKGKRDLQRFGSWYDLPLPDVESDGDWAMVSPKLVEDLAMGRPVDVLEVERLRVALLVALEKKAGSKEASSFELLSFRLLKEGQMVVAPWSSASDVTPKVSGDAEVIPIEPFIERQQRQKELSRTLLQWRLWAVKVLLQWRSGVERLEARAVRKADKRHQRSLSRRNQD